MKRLLIWLVFLAVPVLAWLAFTDSGRSLIFPDAHTTSSTISNVEPSLQKNDSTTPRQLVLIPAQPASTEPSLRIQLSDNKPSSAPGNNRWVLGLIITDPQGRRSGIDALKATVYQDIPHSSAEHIVSPGHAGNQYVTIVVTITPALSTAYLLEISGKKTTDYRLAVSGTSPTLESITEVSQGDVSADTLVHYKIDLTKIKSLSLSDGRGMVGRAVNPAEAFVSSPQARAIPPTKPTDPAVIAAAEAIAKDPCGYFLQTLKTVPNEKLTRKDDNIKSLLDENTFLGCEVMLVTNNTLLAGLSGMFPSFSADEGTELYRLGWRNDNSIGGDAPGSSLSGIESYSARCLVSSDQPAELDEKTGEITQSETLVLTIQCRKR